MTEESLLLVGELKQKVRLLFGEYEKLEKRNDALQQEIISLRKEVKVLNEEKGALGTRYENLKMAQSIGAGYSDSRAARLRINRLLREIDKCVALLNE